METNEELLKILKELLKKEGDGLTVSFSSSARNTNVIKSAVAEALKDGQSESASKPAQATQATQDLNKTNKELSNKAQQVINQNKEAEKNVKSLLGHVNNLNNNLGNIEDELENIRKENKLDSSQIKRISDAIITATLDVGKKSLDATKDRLGWLEKLEKSGIRLAGGFENNFTTMSNLAKMSHDSFANMLTANSKQIANMNAMGQLQLQRFMHASGNLAGKFGYNTEEASKIMLHYVDTIAMTQSAEELRNRNISKEVEILGKNMKALSIATGKSVETLIKEQEQREKNLLMAKINRDPQMKAFLQLAESAGIDTDVVMAAITGRPNEKSAQMNITAGGRALNQALANIAQGIKSGDPKMQDAYSMASYLASVQNDSRFRSDVNAIGTMNYGKAGALNQTAYGDVLTSLNNFGKFRFNLEAMRQVGSGSDDENVINALTNVKAEKDILNNIKNQKFSMNLDGATTLLNIFSGAVRKASDALNDVPKSLVWLTNIGMGAASMLGLDKVVIKMVGDFSLRWGKRFIANPMLALKLITTQHLIPGIKMVGSTAKQLATHLLKSIAHLGVLKAGSLGLGSILFFMEDQLTRQWAGSARDNPWGVLGSKMLFNAMAGGAIGGSIMGPKGALWGAAIGAGAGLIETVWDLIVGSESDGNAKLNENDLYPANENTYNTTANTTHNTYYEQRQSRDNESVRLQREGLEYQKRTANNTDTLPADYQERRFNRSGELQFAR